MKLSKLRLRPGVYLGAGSENVLSDDRYAFDYTPALLLVTNKKTGDKWGVPWSLLEPFRYEEDEKPAKPAGRGTREL